MEVGPVTRGFSENLKLDENPNFLTDQLITYIGNKRSLLDFIGKGLEKTGRRLDKRRLSTYDVFSGSGVVARFLKKYSDRLVVSDLEKYSAVINRCYLSNRTDYPIEEVKYWNDRINGLVTSEPIFDGVISQYYSPKNDRRILPDERVFYTNRNAVFLDSARKHIEKAPAYIQDYLLAPLLSEASIHANTSGVFKGFHKDPSTGTGKFGGKNGDALKRILGDIALPLPILSNFECPFEVYEGDSNILAEQIDDIDVAYIDPPYNQHPYGSNYFMLNLLLNNGTTAPISKVSGIPNDWNRSVYNRRQKAKDAFEDLIESINAKMLLISFNSEGFISKQEMQTMLKKNGKLEILETRYNTFRGSRNLRKRNIHVKEYLYLLEKS